MTVKPPLHRYTGVGEYQWPGKTGRAWWLGFCLILLALAVVVMAVGPTGAIALPACCLAAGFLSVPAELRIDPGPDPSSLRWT